MIRTLFTAVIFSMLGYAAGRTQMALEAPAADKISAFLKSKSAALVEKAGKVCVSYTRDGARRETCFEKDEVR